MKGVEQKTDLPLPRRVHLPSHILMQNLCVAHLCHHRWAISGGAQMRGWSCRLKADLE